MDISKVKRYYETIVNNQAKIQSIDTDIFIEVVECLFKEIERIEGK